MSLDRVKVVYIYTHGPLANINVLHLPLAVRVRDGTELPVLDAHRRGAESERGDVIYSNALRS